MRDCISGRREMWYQDCLFWGRKGAIIEFQGIGRGERGGVFRSCRQKVGLKYGKVSVVVVEIGCEFRELRGLDYMVLQVTSRIVVFIEKGKSRFCLELVWFLELVLVWVGVGLAFLVRFCCFVDINIFIECQYWVRLFCGQDEVLQSKVILYLCLSTDINKVVA